jgi:hypothetical protein
MTASRQKSFGRKASMSREAPEVRVVERPPAEAIAPTPVPLPKTLAELPPLPLRDDVDAEVEQWNAVRKARKRSFREPWRTAAIVSTIGFGLSSWLLPDDVSMIVDLITGGLAVGSVIAGVRTPKYRPPTVTTDPA